MKLFVIITSLLLNIHVMASDQLKDQLDKYQGSSLLYDLYDISTNGIKGTAFAAIAVPCTAGLYIPWSYWKLGDLSFKKLCLIMSNAKQFGNHTREEIEQEVKLREFFNRGGKALSSTAYLLLLGAILLRK